MENSGLDEEHRRIMSALNRLHCMEEEGIEESVLRSILQDLLSYTEKHCLHEEEMMHSCSFDGYNSQRKAHQRMIQKTRELISGIREKDEMDLFYRSVTLLNQWWVNHIQMMDREYVPVMQAFFGGDVDQRSVESE